MAYFMPSYFQKRLLRYALSRLDFVKTDDLDLENLDISWGQRSVIELKDVGIQVKKLVTLLNIPASILVTRARIGFLRLTIPADLYASGIVVEIGQIDVQIRLHTIEKQASPAHVQHRERPGPSKGNRADRPRIGSPAVHDPGGTRRRRLRHGTIADTGIPTSEDLALSFLESEPLEERKELQSIVQSQSQYLQASSYSAAGDGIGAPGGFELPTFVANFFKGIADRLSVDIKDVSLTVEISLPQVGSEALDTVKLQFKVFEIELHGLTLHGNGQQTGENRREITVKDVELVLLSAPELVSQMPQSSTSSSPIVSRPDAKLSSASSKSMSAAVSSPRTSYTEPASQKHVPASRSTLSQQSSDSSGSSQPAFASDMGLGIMEYGEETYDDQSTEGSFVSHQPHMPRVRGLSHSAGSTSRIDNQTNAENLAFRGELEGPAAHVNTTLGQSQDLSESRVFSHDEAESMYMSALSHELEQSHIPKVMPGGWDWSESEEQRSITPTSPDLHRKTSTLQQSGRAESLVESEPIMRSGASVPNSRTSSLPVDKSAEIVENALLSSDLMDESSVAKRVMSISFVTLSLATKEDHDATMCDHSQLEQQRVPTHAKNTSVADESMYSQFSSRMFATAEDDRRDQASQSKMEQFDHEAARARQAIAPRMIIGTASVSVDLPIGRLFVRILQELIPWISSLGMGGDAKPPESGPSPFEANIAKIEVNVCEEVPELFHEISTSSPLATGAYDQEQLLLRVALSVISLKVSSDSYSTLQRLNVNKVSVYHRNKSVLSFEELLNLRSSGSASTLPLRDDVVVVTRTTDSLSRTNVQTKSLKLRLDLLQIDDVLSRSGGLSSLLDLGNSIVSTSTIRGGPPTTKAPAPRQRSVRFEPPRNANRDDESTSSPRTIKVDVRIAGMDVELIGSDSAMHVRSSAVKFSYRKDLIGLQIDWTELEGPLLRDQSSGDIKLKISNTRLEYSNSPKEADLEQLLSILSPSSDKHALEQEDDIMIDTLIRQRRKGGVLRLTLTSLETTIRGLQWQAHLVKLGDELSRLSSVSKYLPEDDRPGMLTLALLKKVDVNFILDPAIGVFILKAGLAEAAHVNVPSLMAAHVDTLQVLRDKEPIVTDIVSSSDPKLAMRPPMIMIRYIADEMEPTIRLKVFNLMLEYRISTVAALIELSNAFKLSGGDSGPLSPTSSVSSSSNSAMTRSRNKIRISLAVRDSALGLSPLKSSSKAILLLTDTTLHYSAGKDEDLEAGIQLKKLSMLVSDDAALRNLPSKNADPKMFFDESLQVQELVGAGFVPVAFLSAASVTTRVSPDKSTKDSTTNIEINKGLLILETCADSTQTMIHVLSGLSPPALPSKVERYRTEIVPIQDMLASFTGNAYFTEPGPQAGLQAMIGIEEATDEDMLEGDHDSLDDSEEPEDDDADFMGHLWQSQSEVGPDDMSESYLDSELARSNASAALSSPPVAPTEDVMEASREDIMVHSMLNFQEDHFSRKEAVGGTAHRWDSKQNTYDLGSDAMIRKSPLRVKVCDVHFIWHLFDGYDWQATRESISQAVQDIETKASARRPRSSSRLSPRPHEDDESEIGDFLFNSIYIGIPANRDPRDLTSAINREIDDMTSETGSYATTITNTASPVRRPTAPRTRQKRLRLERGKHHKMAFELKGISADFITFPPGSGEVESSIDVRFKDLEVIDQLPTSTWKKFATYMHDAGEREVDTNMVHIEILNIKPVAELAASEVVLKLTVLPLRLHVDQDAIDFMTRFFEFKDDRVPVSTTPSTPLFLQRVEVNPIRLKLDFKPKRVDYAGLRSGRTTEFMNFFVLDRADMVLRRVILYGVLGLDRVGIMLNNIWSPDVRRNQLPGVLAGLAPIRSLVDVGSGVRDLVVVPMREYKKDGRIVRSIQKGALAFAKTTTKELVNLGAKLAIGTQTVLQDTEKMLGQANEQDRREDQGEDEEKKQISLYADQPLGIVQGLCGAYASLERDLLLARDAIVAVPGEVMATESATGAAQAVLRSAPTIILRPAIGASKAVGQTLLGAGNTLDREKYRRVQEKYKRH